MDTDILATPTLRSIDRGDGTANVVCPLCGTVVHELDVEIYCEAGTERKVECCTTCREELEDEHELSVDSDVLDASTFRKLWDYAQTLAQGLREAHGRGISEANAELVAEALGGEVRRADDTWVVLLHIADDRRIVITLQDVSEYRNEHAFQAKQPSQVIALR
jgi:hypothetical protein